MQFDSFAGQIGPSVANVCDVSSGLYVFPTIPGAKQGRYAPPLESGSGQHSCEHASQPQTCLAASVVFNHYSNRPVGEGGVISDQPLPVLFLQHHVTYSNHRNLLFHSHYRLGNKIK